MKIAIGNDHAAVAMKFDIMEYIRSLNHEVTDYGTDTEESCDYPEYGEKVARAVASGEADCGVLICGTGVGISIAANKIKGAPPSAPTVPRHAWSGNIIMPIFWRSARGLWEENLRVTL